MRIPILGLALGCTLLASVAIPLTARSTNPAPIELQIKSPIDGQVLTTHVATGTYVRRGAILARLDDTEIRTRIATLTEEIKALEAGDKMPVVESPILGSIGTMPRIVYTNDPLPAKEIPKTVSNVSEAANPEHVKAVKALAEFDAKVGPEQRALDANQGAFDEATSALAKAKADLDTAQAEKSKASQDLAKSQKLFDAGAIPKVKLTTAEAAESSADSEVVARQKDVDDAQVRYDSAKSSLNEASKKYAGLADSRRVLVAKVDATPEKLTKTETLVIPNQAPRALPKRRIVFATAPIGSTAPVSVKLVDSNSPDVDSQIRAKQELIRRLRDELDQLAIKAPVDGYVGEMFARPGRKSLAGQVLVKFLVQP